MFANFQFFMDLQEIGKMIVPLETGCVTQTESDTCSETTVAEAPLNPPTMIIGCHMTQQNKTKRNFAHGEFDEIAFWDRRLNNSEKPYFLGGYSKLKKLDYFSTVK